MHAHVRAVSRAREESTGRSSARVHPLLALQRKAGNAAVTGLVMQRFGRQVEPGDEVQLVQLIQSYRNVQGYHQRAFARGGHNVAVAFNGLGMVIATRHSNGGNHGEVNLDNAVGAANRGTVGRIHTEREPCGGCETMITNNYITPGHLAENEVTYWGEYQVKKEKGTAALKDLIETSYEKESMKKIEGSVSKAGRVSHANPKYVS